MHCREGQEIAAALDKIGCTRVFTEVEDALPQRLEYRLYSLSGKLWACETDPQFLGGSRFGSSEDGSCEVDATVLRVQLCKLARCLRRDRTHREGNTAWSQTLKKSLAHNALFQALAIVHHPNH